MPHIILECTKNIKKQLDTTKLLHTLHHQLASYESFRLDYIKSRIVFHEVFIVAERGQNTCFMHCEVNLMQGRNPELVKSIGEKFLEILNQYAAALSLPCWTSVEMREMPKTSYFADIIEPC